MTPAPAFPEDMRERVERFIAAVPDCTVMKGADTDLGTPLVSLDVAALARWALERDAEAKRLEEHAEELRTMMDGYWAQIKEAEAKLAAGRAEAERLEAVGWRDCGPNETGPLHTDSICATEYADGLNCAAEAIRRAME